MTFSDCVIRPAAVNDAKALTNVHVDSWRTTYRGIVADEVLDNLRYEPREKFWTETLSQPNNGVFVTEHPIQGIVGFSSGGKEREGFDGYDGELYAIYLLEAAQGQGLGKALAKPVVDQLIETGFSAMLVWVLADNPSRKFYEALGGIEIGEQTINIGGEDHVEVAYGWKDLAVLSQRCS